MCGRLHRRVVDRPRWRDADAAAILVAPAQGITFLSQLCRIDGVQTPACGPTPTRQPIVVGRQLVTCKNTFVVAHLFFFLY